MRPVLDRGTVLAASLSLLSSALLLPAASMAQGQPPVPLGDPFEVAADPAGEQSFADVARNRDGSFVVVWRHQPWIEHGEWNVHARRFDAEGQPRGAGYRINVEPVHGDYRDLDVELTPGGGFVVAWESFDPYPNRSDVFARVYDADARPLGPPFLAPEEPIDDQYLVGVAVEEGGLFTVAWSYYDYGYDPVGARVFESSGVPRTGDLVIDTSDGSYIYQASLAASGPGEFVVGYSPYDYGYYSYDSEVRAQKFDVDGNITVAEFRVDEGSGAAGYYGQPVEVGSDAAGNFTVLWGTGYGTSDVRARRFSPDAQPLGSEFVVGSTDDIRHLAVSPGGRSLVYWERDYYGGELQAQLWSPDGTPEGPPFEVVDPTAPGHYLGAALDASESPVFVWNEWRVNQGYDVLARRFQTFERIFLDGFESGDTVRWSTQLP